MILSKINIREWNEAEFDANQKVWNQLLAESSANPLFLSWEWMNAWWKAFSSDALQLKILAAYNDQQQLIGLAPLYLSSATTKGLINTKRLQWIGSAWYCDQTMRSELLEFIAASSSEVAVIKALIQYISQLNDWNELILSELKTSSETFRQLDQSQKILNVYRREDVVLESYYIDTSQNLEAYKSSIGKNTRLKMFNRRKLLNTLGKVEFLPCVQDSAEEQLELLNQLHSKRWNKRVFEDKFLRFNQTVARAFSKKNMLKTSLIKLNGEVLSIQYNFLVEQRLYNIQAGFNPDLHKKISLGYLHFGYVAEAACLNGIQAYELLAGEGMNSNYKVHMTKTKNTIHHMQMVRGFRLKNLFAFFDKVQKVKTKLMN